MLLMFGIGMIIVAPFVGTSMYVNDLGPFKDDHIQTIQGQENEQVSLAYIVASKKG